MRVTLMLDDDVAAALERVRRTRNASLKDVVNDALRRGLNDLSTALDRAGANESDAERLKREERALRERISTFRAADRLPREDVHRRRRRS
jgi:hypothetical protein